jgi:hypothetical protein
VSEGKNPVRKGWKIILVVCALCLLVSAGYYGRLVLQSMSTGVSIKDLDEHNILFKKRLMDEKF